MDKEIVISVYDREILWIDDIADNVKKTIYRKGNNQISKYNEIKISNNVGRDVHTFFYHIVKNYDNLSDITFFCQDHPFDHWGNIIGTVNSGDLDSRCEIKIDGYYGFHNNSIGSSWQLKKSNQFGDGFVLSCRSDGWPHHAHENLNLNTYWDLFFDSPIPSDFEFIPGGHFAITKEQIRIRSKKFYQEIVSFLENEIISPWVIERFECYIFNKNFKTKN
jgi:hypothetical protein